MKRAVQRKRERWLIAKAERSDSRVVKRLKNELKRKDAELAQRGASSDELVAYYEKELDDIRRAKDQMEETLLDRIERIGRELACAELENQGLMANHVKFVKMQESEAAIHVARARIIGQGVQDEDMV